MKKYIIHNLFILLCFLLSACNDWLDVKPNSQTELDEMFSSYDGFKSALTGCYIKLKDRSLYGENLTMSHIESLAQLWALQENSQRQADLSLSKYDYQSIYAKEAITEIYSGFYNVIVQANTIIEHIETNGSHINDSVSFALIKGETYAIRALCHLDILRIFGQMPENPIRKVRLPYAEEVSIKNHPAYYDYDTFCAKIEKDLSFAETALEKKDPVIKQGITYNNNEDDLHNYRGLDLNYYAVKALQSRFYLYTNQPDKAYAAARVIYDAMPVKLSGLEDLNKGYNALPSECLFALSNNELIDYSIDVLGYGSQQLQPSQLYITSDMLSKLYQGVDISSHNRYALSWNKTTPDILGENRPVVTKYYYNTSTSYAPEVYLTKLQLVPIIRMSEIYLILMETTRDLEEANALYTDYMMSHNVGKIDQFTSLEKVKTFVIDEIRREFYAEGQMFYTYKRHGIRRMLFANEDIGEEQFIVPLPDTEYNPAELNR